MESILFIVLMVAGHILMMFVMPGMHGGHNHKGHGHADPESNVVKAKINQNEL